MYDKLGVVGKSVCNVVALACFGVVAWGTYTKTGIPGEFIRLQVALFGAYRPMMTILFLLVPCSLVSLLLGAIVDFAIACAWSKNPQRRVTRSTAEEFEEYPR